MKKFFLIVVLIFISTVSVFAYVRWYNHINYNEKFPNGANSSLTQSTRNGWSSPSRSEKNIMTPEGCRRIVSRTSDLSFIPTATSQEWEEYKKNHPQDISIHLCYECGNNGVIWYYPDHCIDDGWPHGTGDGIEFYCDARYVRACLTYESCPWRNGKYTNKAPTKRSDRFGAYGDSGHNFSCWSADLRNLYEFMKRYSDY